MARSSGIVGAGGAGFPTHVKLSAKVDTYIVNAAECEPLLRVDQQLMQKYPEKLITGLQLGMKATGAKRGIIAIKRKYKSAIKKVKQAIKTDSRLEIFLLEDVYPAGDEHVLVYEALGKTIPESGLPLDIGAVVNNVYTLINLADASEGKSIVSRYVTVTGAVKKPVTMDFPIGTSILDTIKAAGGATIDNFEVLINGPMMGSLIDPKKPITKLTSGVIVLPEDHFVIRMKNERISSKVIVTKAACIRCQLCTEVCPRFLLGHQLYPDKVMRGIAWGAPERPEYMTGTFLCVECGACTYYGCPMGLDPCKMMTEVKGQLRVEGLKNTHNRKVLSIHPEREYRKLPVKRLMSRLDLLNYDNECPIRKRKLQIREVSIPLKQHIGDPAIPIVKVGETVKKGVLIGKIPDGSLGAVIHASISGIIRHIGQEIVIEKTK
ncbi:electron transport complex protein RnfC [Candidatus Heimdallarchaeota archaeon B3_Heim]|nr:MAG: electron transport complex protein RnfC [Candidatus Heimdallarchaeota archaeon B3_Heim]